jgi:hypothetical protein
MPNKVEQEAIRFVMKRERKDNPRKAPYGRGYDILTDRRRIEVKGVTHGIHAILNSHNIKAAKRYRNYYLYIVSFKNGKPQLAVFTKTQLLKRRKRESTWYVSLKKGDFKP